jgi:hypothetical protein
MYIESEVTIYDNYDYSFVYDDQYLIYARGQYNALASNTSNFPTSHILYVAPLDYEIPPEGLNFTHFRKPSSFREAGESLQYGPGFDEHLRDELAKEGKGIWEIKRIMDTKIVEAFLYR